MNQADKRTNERKPQKTKPGLQSSKQTSSQNGGLSSKQHDDLVLRTDTRLSERTWLSPEEAAVKDPRADLIYIFVYICIYLFFI